jgi:hypothetical protein
VSDRIVMSINIPDVTNPPDGPIPEQYVIQCGSCQVDLAMYIGEAATAQ